MVTDKDGRASLIDVFPSTYFITDEGEFAEQPRPQPQEKVGDLHGSAAEEGREQEARKQQQHEYDEHQQCPENVRVSQNSQTKAFFQK